MARPLNQEDWETIIMNRAFGMDIRKNAEKIGRSVTSVGSVLQAFDAVMSEDWTKCCNLIVTYDLGLDLFQWAAQKTGKTIPPVISKAYEDWKEERRRKNLADVKAKEEEKPTPDAQGGDLKIMISQLLAEQRKIRELLETLLDVVIPKYVGDLKDNINVNCDVINKTNLESQEKLEAIKLGFRKKGL